MRHWYFVTKTTLLWERAGLTLKCQTNTSYITQLPPASFLCIYCVVSQWSDCVQTFFSTFDIIYFAQLEANACPNGSCGWVHGLVTWQPWTRVAIKHCSSQFPSIPMLLPSEKCVFICTVSGLEMFFFFSIVLSFMPEEHSYLWRFDNHKTTDRDVSHLTIFVLSSSHYA